MILLGGFTRLTHSGLSMVEWKPLVGTIPPLSHSAWQSAFELYQQFPEYQKINQGMSLGEFQRIYLVEYSHRLLGRFTGFVFLLPLLYYWLRGRLTPRLKPQLLILLCLGGLQGLLGWYMVRSGLIDRPQVSQYRLTAHLGLAVLLYGYLLWLAMGLLRPANGADEKRVSGVVRWLSLANVGLVFLMILSGGLVAGTRAGFIANTFPRMHGYFVPPGLYATDPFWRAAFEDLLTVQFNHRLLALVIVIVTVGLFALARRQPSSRRLNRRLLTVGTLLGLQILLGVTTLLLVVPIRWALAHQAGAIILFSATLWLGHEATQPRREATKPGYDQRKGDQTS